MKPLRILIADDHAMIRRGLRATLEDHRGWQVLDEAVHGREAVEKARRLKPDIVILDLTMPQLNGLEATRQILRTAPATHVLILTVHESEQVVREVLKAGAQGYILKSDAGRDLVAGVEALGQGKPFFTSKVARMVLEGYLGREAMAKSARPQERLSAREREIVQLLAEGKSNKEVASTLGISVRTAETHRNNLMQKLSFHSISDLVRYAIREKMIEP
jgi:DNA-binding NarL/FixJ family response regulator